MDREVFIRIRGLKKSFKTKEGIIPVLRDITLDIGKGDIFGIIGFSGAGKSTLLRCINRLETPDQGSVNLGQIDITGLSKKSLNATRQKIGMIFQQFNLFDSRTVAENIAYPLEIAGWSKKAAETRVDELLELVELTEKANVFTAHLSGGQKQRVGIARALANNPELLLSDEATSALDPQTTYSILELLKDINKKLGVTIILVTHELEVIKYTCSSVAVIEDGLITEKGSVRSVFQNPQSATARQFILINNQFLSDTVVEQGSFI